MILLHIVGARVCTTQIHAQLNTSVFRGGYTIGTSGIILLPFPLRFLFVADAFSQSLPLCLSPYLYIFLSVCVSLDLTEIVLETALTIVLAAAAEAEVYCSRLSEIFQFPAQVFRGV